MSKPDRSPVRGIALALCVLGPITAPAADTATNFPTKPIRLIIANTTGTSVDTLARVLGVRLGEELGQQVVSDNRGGAHPSLLPSLYWQQLGRF